MLRWRRKRALRNAAFYRNAFPGRIQAPIAARPIVIGLAIAGFATGRLSLQGLHLEALLRGLKSRGLKSRGLSSQGLPCGRGALSSPVDASSFTLARVPAGFPAASGSSFGEPLDADIVFPCRDGGF